MMPPLATIAQFLSVGGGARAVLTSSTIYFQGIRPTKWLFALSVTTSEGGGGIAFCLRPTNVEFK